MLIYRLDIRPGLKAPSLCVKLEEQGTRRILYADTLKAQAQAKDVPAIQFLTKLHVRANAGKSFDTLSFQEIHLPAPVSNEAIRLMANTDRLYIQGHRLIIEPKRAQLFWKGEQHSEKSATLEAFMSVQFSKLTKMDDCKQLTEEISLNSVDFLFPGEPFWVIVGGKWIEIETDVAWKWIELFRSGASMLEGVQKKLFLEEAPCIRWNPKPKATQLQTLPMLAICDGTGSFANLWMDYPGIGKIAFEDMAPQIGGRTRLKKEEEQWEKDLLEAGYLRKAVGQSRYYCPGEKVEDTLRFLLELGWKCMDLKGRNIVLQNGVEIQIAGEETIRVGGNVCFQEKKGSLRQAIAASQKKRLFLELDHESVGLLDSKSFPALEGIWEDEHFVLPKQRIGELSFLIDRKEALWDPSLEKTAKALQNRQELNPFFLDERFKGNLLPYQEKGVEWLFLLQRGGFHALLSDEMGLGKTVQVLAFFSQLKTNLPILIVAPTSLLFNWRSEIARFWPSAEVRVHAGLDRAQTADAIQSQGVVLTSYALLRQDLDLFSTVYFEAIALDESQAIKSFTSLVAQAAYTLNARFKVAITGTPIENRPDELWSQFKFLMPDLLGSRSEFLSTPSESVRQRIKPFILKRTKEEVQIQLPEKVDHPLWVEMTEEQEAHYEQTLSAFKNNALRKIEADGFAAHRMEVLEVILRLRQISSDSRLCGGVKMGAKAQILLTMAEQWGAAGKKALVFSQFASWLYLLKKDLQAIGIEPLHLDGSTPQEERGELVRRFQEESTPHLFLVSLKAGGVGLNLTAAESVVLLDPWWNEAVERQAIDRAHRIGQKNTLWVHRFLTPHSIEEKMLSIKARKSNFSDEFLGAEAWSATDLMELL